MRKNALEQFGIDQPKSDFERIRDGRTSMPLWLDIDLSTARSISAGTALFINIAGNSFYIDADTANVGVATVHFQDTNLGNASAPFYVNPGFIANVGFTQVLIENASQAGKRLRIFYGVDIDFQAGVNSNINISGTVSNGSQVRKALTNTAGSVGLASAQLVAANASRDYLLIQNTHATANIYVRVDGGAASNTTGVKIGPGGSYELASTVPIGAIMAISDTAATPVVIVEG